MKPRITTAPPMPTSLNSKNTIEKANEVALVKQNTIQTPTKLWIQKNCILLSFTNFMRFRDVILAVVVIYF